LIDDLITQGTQEPYRMFTSRAEYRLLLREDNADLRLTEKGRTLGLVHENRWQAFCEKQEAIETTRQRLKDTWVRVSHNEQLQSTLDTPIAHDCRALDLLKRPEINYTHLQAIAEFNLPELNEAVHLQIEIQSKYAGYIDRQQQDIQKLRKQESTLIPKSFDYQKVSGLSNEIVQKLTKIQPETIGQAARIQGMTPAALSLLLISIKKQHQKEINES
jgi:tRNA uridine 5-carboxymethylaminomethyl modification enzyme